MVTRIPLSALALFFTLSPAVFPFAANADPRVLMAPELAEVTAGAVSLPPIQINVNTNAQVATAIPVAVAVCAVCKGAPIAVAQGSAFNINLASLINSAR
jgi:hypothetical protein